ncbi:hypothetical protein T10_7105 [Trichinella papuae]|uniref:Uncharacterized protein n=1 Tax=Trichinella papuae TaxID=268474 RepID=A0A0V1MLA3_9BILA|nr:hypothetical protein T10_7105 [Trichinella papuae]
MIIYCGREKKIFCVGRHGIRISLTAKFVVAQLNFTGCRWDKFSSINSENLFSEVPDANSKKDHVERCQGWSNSVPLFNAFSYWSLIALLYWTIKSRVLNYKFCSELNFEDYASCGTKYRILHDCLLRITGYKKMHSHVLCIKNTVELGLSDLCCFRENMAELSQYQHQLPCE